MVQPGTYMLSGLVHEQRMHSQDGHIHPLSLGNSNIISLELHLQILEEEMAGLGVSVTQRGRKNAAGNTVHQYQPLITFNWS